MVLPPAWKFIASDVITEPGDRTKSVDKCGASIGAVADERGQRLEREFALVADVFLVNGQRIDSTRARRHDEASYHPPIR